MRLFAREFHDSWTVTHPLSTDLSIVQAQIRTSLAKFQTQLRSLDFLHSRGLKGSSELGEHATDHNRDEHMSVITLRDAQTAHSNAGCFIGLWTVLFSHSWSWICLTCWNERGILGRLFSGHPASLQLYKQAFTCQKNSKGILYPGLSFRIWFLPGIVPCKYSS